MISWYDYRCGQVVLLWVHKHCEIMSMVGSKAYVRSSDSRSNWLLYRQCGRRIEVIQLTGRLVFPCV